MGGFPEVLSAAGDGEGVKVAVAMLASSGGDV